MVQNGACVGAITRGAKEVYVWGVGVVSGASWSSVGVFRSVLSRLDELEPRTGCKRKVAVAGTCWEQKKRFGPVGFSGA